MMSEKNEMKRVNIRISPSVYDFFKERSDSTGVSMSALMFLALEEHVNQHTIIPQIPKIMEELKKRGALHIDAD